MFNDLIGDLSEIRLYDLLKPLVDGKKSGLLSIKGSKTAEVHVEAGRIVCARVENRTGEEALPILMDLENGRVTFDWRTSPAEQTIALPTEQIMSRWATQEAEWRRIRSLVPSTKAIFTLVVDNSGRDRLIPGDRWGILALCNGRRQVAAIADQLGRSVFEVAAAIGDMTQEGWLEKADQGGSAEETKPTVTETFFDAAEQELKKVMGPIARIILNDTLYAFEESREAFPKDRVKSFISTICDQIPEGPKRDKFGKAMYSIWFTSFENN